MNGNFLKLILTFTVLNFFVMHSQVGIGTSTPSQSAALDISSTNTGLLIPRINLNNDSDRSNVLKPEKGLLIFNPTKTGTLEPGFYYWDGIWKGLGVQSATTSSTNNSWNLTGNSNTNSSTHYVGTSDWVDLAIKVRATQVAKFKTQGEISIGMDANAIGQHSYALGNNATAGANYAYAIGPNTQAKSQYSYALGQNAIAVSNYSYAIGPNALAENQYSYALGNNAIVKSNNSYAIGYSANATGYESMAIGKEAKSSENDTFAIGNNANASGYQALAIGKEAKSSNNSTLAIGNNANASGYQSIAIGLNSAAANSNSIAIGNNAKANQNNAIVIGENSNTIKIGMGTSTPDEKLHVIGSVKIVDGNQGNGKILVSDANGKASWATYDAVSANTNKAFADLVVSGLSNSDLNYNTASSLYDKLTISNNTFKFNYIGYYKITYQVTDIGNGSRNVTISINNNGSTVSNSSASGSINGNGDLVVTKTKIIKVDTNTIGNTYKINSNSTNIDANKSFVLIEQL